MRASMLSDWLAQRIERTGGQPIYRQLYGLLQQAILSRELPAGTKVPSSRLLASELGLGRKVERAEPAGWALAQRLSGVIVCDSPVTDPDPEVESYRMKEARTQPPRTRTPKP